MEVTISYSTDENYVKYLCVSVMSLIAHTSPINTYRIVILTDDISEKSKENIKSTGKGKDNISFEFIDCKNFFSRNVYVGDFSIACYYRFMLIDLFPNADRILYLDVDTIILTDVAELYKIDITGYYFAAVRDLKIILWCSIKNYDLKTYMNNVLKLKDTSNYVNSGVLLLNLSELRKDYGSEKLINMAANFDYRFFDQDVLNIIGQDKIYFLDFRWNFFGIIEQSEFAIREDSVKYEELAKNIAIIHYAGRKPWKLITDEYDFFFWKYAFLSPKIKDIWAEVCKNNDYQINDMWLNEKRVLTGIYDGKVGFMFCLRLLKATAVGSFRCFIDRRKKKNK